MFSVHWQPAKNHVLQYKPINDLLFMVSAFLLDSWNHMIFLRHSCLVNILSREKVSALSLPCFLKGFRTKLYRQAVAKYCRLWIYYIHSLLTENTFICIQLYHFFVNSILYYALYSYIFIDTILILKHSLFSCKLIISLNEKLLAKRILHVGFVSSSCST